MKLFIGNLPYNITENELVELFSKYVDVVTSKLVMDNFTGQPKGFGFVEMGNRREGQKAMEELNGKVYKYRQLVCNEAKDKKKSDKTDRLTS